MRLAALTLTSYARQEQELRELTSYCTRLEQQNDQMLLCLTSLGVSGPWNNSGVLTTWYVTL